MSQPPTGAEGYPPQPPGGTVYGPPYAGQPVPHQYGPTLPGPTLPQPVAPAPAPSAPGQYAPAYPQPLSAPPVAGPGFGPQPMSAPPGAVPPYGAPVRVPVAGAGRGRTTLVLAVLAVLAVVAGLFFVLGGVMTGLYVTTSGKLDRAERQVSQRDGTIAANQREVDKLKADLQTVRDKLADTEQDLTGTKNDRDEQARQKKVIATCLDKLTAAIAAASTGNKAAFDKASKGLDKVCDEAENYL